MSYAFKYLDCKFEEPNEDYFGYIYYTYDQKRSMGYVGQKCGKVKDSEDYYGSGIIIKAIIKKRGTYFLKKTVLGVCYSEEELDEWETYCKEFFDVYCPNGYNIARKDTGGDTWTYHPDPWSRVKKRRDTITIKYGNYYPAWNIGLTKETDERVALNSIKSGRTRKLKFETGELSSWCKGKNKENDQCIRDLIEKQKVTKNSLEWKETKGKKMKESRAETILNNPQIMKDAGKKSGKTQKRKHAKGELSIWNEGQTKETNNSLKIVSEKNKKTHNDPIWKKEVGTKALEKARETRKKNGTSIGNKNPAYKDLSLYTSGIIDLYQNKSESLTSISKLFNCSIVPIKRVLKENNITLRNSTEINRLKSKCTSKKVINLDTGEIFSSITSATNYYYTTRTNFINDCCKGKRETCKLGYHWEYYNE
jgi:hypothetical protein